MTLCPNCGVDLGPAAKLCPLCGARIAIEPERPAPALALNSRSRRKAWELFTVACLLPALSVLAIDLSDAALSWSAYPLAGLAFVWVLVSAFWMLASKPILMIAIAAAAPPALLFALDAVDGSLGWSFSLGLPISLGVELCALGVIAATAMTKRKGFNVIAYGLFSATIACFCIDLTVSLFLGMSILVSWSLVVAFAVLPVASMLLYVHYKVSTKSTLRKIFRL